MKEEPITPGMMPPRGLIPPPTQQQMAMSPQYQNGIGERPYPQQQIPNQYISSPHPPTPSQFPQHAEGMKTPGMMLPPMQPQMGVSPQYRNGNGKQNLQLFKK